MQSTPIRVFQRISAQDPSPAAKHACPISVAMNEPVLVIVDDDRNFAAKAADLARSRGFATHVAHSVAESERFAGMPRDLSLLDVDLPDGSGFDVLDRFAPRDSEKIVLVSGSGCDGDEDRDAPLRAPPASVADYLTKPLSL